MTGVALRDYEKATPIAEIQSGQTAIWVGKIPTSDLYWAQKEVGELRLGKAISEQAALAFYGKAGSKVDLV